MLERCPHCGDRDQFLRALTRHGNFQDFVASTRRVAGDVYGAFQNEWGAADFRSIAGSFAGSLKEDLGFSSASDKGDVSSTSVAVDNPKGLLRQRIAEKQAAAQQWEQNGGNGNDGRVVATNTFLEPGRAVDGGSFLDGWSWWGTCARGGGCSNVEEQLTLDHREQVVVLGASDRQAVRVSYVGADVGAPSGSMAESISKECCADLCAGKTDVSQVGHAGERIIATPGLGRTGTPGVGRTGERIIATPGLGRTGVSAVGGDGGGPKNQLPVPARGRVRKTIGAGEGVEVTVLEPPPSGNMSNYES